ncbi:UTRA domain-containing protein [Sulfitobacter sp. D35]|uniref:UTRA domain-containing protein n=1 Tax=Sulfitobacter sp. D35 TaxID=3083252 RepID=UPI00296F1634|nr:UTRA domain-containing protein [Sulfitobacter sp. D35]MDW4497254.1 UTRA domain-containing protein [Sulfitobacter sp. D35]
MSGQRPIYRTVKNALQHRIETGALRVGDQLPSEEAIAQEFDCSRLTAHRAVRELAAEGFVERRRRAGTTVLPRERGGVLIRIPLIRDEVAAAGKSYRYELIDLKSVAASARVASDLGLAQGDEVLAVRCRHWGDRTVWQYEERWINPAAAPGVQDQSFLRTSPNRWLLTHVPYSDVTHEITAVAATKAQAVRLGLAIGAPLLQTRRVTSLHGTGITTVTLLHPGGTYTLRSGPAQDGTSA